MIPRLRLLAYSYMRLPPSSLHCTRKGWGTSNFITFLGTGFHEESRNIQHFLASSFQETVGYAKIYNFFWDPIPWKVQEYQTFLKLIPISASLFQETMKLCQYLSSLTDPQHYYTLVEIGLVTIQQSCT